MSAMRRNHNVDRLPTPSVASAAGEVTRRQLSEAEIMEIVRAEVVARMVAADEYETIGQTRKPLGFGPKPTPSTPSSTSNEPPITNPTGG